MANCTLIVWDSTLKCYRTASAGDTLVDGAGAAITSFDPASPGAIGGTTPAAGTFTVLKGNTRTETPTIGTSSSTQHALPSGTGDVLTTDSTATITGKSIAASQLTGQVAVANGGTNLASYAAGDLLYASGATTLAKLAKGSDGEYLSLASGVPVWAAVSSAVRKELFYWFSGGGGIASALTDAVNYTTYSAGSSTALVSPYYALRAGSVTGLFWSGDSNAITAGTLTANFFKNGSAVGGATLASTSGTAGRTTFAAGTYTYVAGDTLEVRFTTSVDYAGPSKGSFGLEVTE